MRNTLKIVVLNLVAIVAVSCSSTKNLPDKEQLYIGAEVKIEDDSPSGSKRKELKEELESLLRPKPNSKFLGMRSKLFFYNLAGNPDKKGGLRNWIRKKMGEPPVLVSQVDFEYNKDLFVNRLENQGFFNAAVSYDTIGKQKKLRAVFHVFPKDQYYIRDVAFLKDSLSDKIQVSRLDRATLLKPGNPYDLETIKEERQRIDGRLKERGYYFFNPDHILVQVDSTVGRYQVDLNVKLKESVPEEALEQYTIDKIIIFSDYDLGDDMQVKGNPDVTTHNDFLIIDPKNRFRPQIYDRAIYFNSGEKYNRRTHNLSLNRLVNLGVFKFVKNQFVVSDSVHNTLDSYYYLTPDKPKAIRLEILGKMNSASYTGSELNLNWSNKNFLKGAEVFRVAAYGGMDFQMGSTNKGFNMFKYGIETSLTWPRIVAPFAFHSASGYVPRTKASLGYEYLLRTKLYALHSFKGAFGYIWKENITKEHDLNLLEVNYVSPENVTELYREYAKGNPSLEKIFQRQLIFGPTYSYTYTNTMRQYKKHTFYYKGGIDLSANITGLVTKANIDKGEEKEILGVPFSQYVKTEHDFRYYLKLDRTSQLAARLHTGLGIPYGNSNQMPYIKQFVVGGPNSVRAFRARTLGPGSFDPTSLNSSFVPDQSGDFLLEMSLEYRKKIGGIVQGALFLDAGNIWLLKDTEDRPGGKLTKDFYKELAVGAGAGLRFDISFLVLRLDFAFPIRIPYYPEGERWTIDKISFGNKNWRRDNLMFNLAIGYPF